MDVTSLDSEALDLHPDPCSKPLWRPRKDRVPVTHHSKEKRSGRGSAKNQLHKLFKREYLVSADIKRSADRLGKWIEEREREDGRGDFEERDHERGGEHPRGDRVDGSGQSEEGDLGDQGEEAGTGETVWDEAMMSAVQDEDRRAWETIRRERERKNKPES
jgi:hypothetical protein